jgi:O-antigen/teichoic acid export membrane protein
VRERLLAARAEVFLYVTTGVANALAFGYQFVMARLLRPDEFALLTQLFGVLVIEAISTQVIQAATAKLAAQYRAREDDAALHVFVRRWLRRIVLLAVPPSVAVALLAIPVSATTGIPALAASLLGVTLGLAGLLTFTLGLLQGLRHFYWLGTNLIAQAFTRLLAGAILVLLGTGVNGAFVGATLALAVGVLLSFVPLRGLLRAARGAVHELALGAEETRFFLTAAVVLLAYAGLINADAVLAPLLLPAGEAGAYAGAVTVAKVILFAPIAVGFILLEATAREHERGADTDRALYLALAFVLTTSGAVALAYVLAPGFFVAVVVGAQYPFAARIVPLYALAALSNALLNLWIAYFVGRGRTAIGSILAAGLAAEVALLVGLARDAESMVRIVTAVALAMQLVAIGTFAWGRLAPRRPEPA